MKRDNWEVGDEGIRPITAVENICTYCRMPHGSQHKPDCVIRQRTVVVRMTVEYVVSVPESWTPEEIEFHRNEGSRCASNSVYELDEIIEKGQCLCKHTTTEYLREATDMDEAEFLIFVKNAVS